MRLQAVRWGMSIGFVATLTLLLIAAPAAAQRRVAAGSVGLPYVAGMDGAGNQWMIFHQGFLQQQGNQPVYAQGARLMVNGANPNVRQHSARLDEKTGELVVENLQAGTIEIERRIRLMDDGRYVRYIDVFRNTAPLAAEVMVQVQTNVGYGLQGSKDIEDPRAGNGPIGVIAPTHGNRSVVEVFAGQRSEVKPNIQSNPGSSMITAQYRLSMAANGTVAIVHLHSTADNARDGEKWILELKDKDVLEGVSRELRKQIVNIRPGGLEVGQFEVLRGDVFDVIELRGGDQFRGTMKQDAWRLTTFYGQVELPVEKVIAMINVGQVQPRQLIVTADGEVFGGTLAASTITLDLTSGQQIQVPLNQISRVGYRLRSDELDEWTFDRPLVLMRQGDRVAVEPPTAPIEVVTRYGTLQLDPKAMAALVFQSDEHRVHEVLLRDGSRFAGLVTAEAFEMRLAAGSQAARFPTSSLLRLQMVQPPEGPGPDAPTLRVRQGDILVGTLTGQLEVQTGFDTIQVNGPEIKQVLVRSEQQGDAVQVIMWDNTSFSGQLNRDVLDLALESGMTVRVPVSLIEKYDHPLPQPSAVMRRQIEQVVVDLDAEDWRLRDRAQAQLVSMGPAVIGLLRELRTSQPPEAQQRIDQVLDEIQKQREAARASERSSAAPGGNASSTLRSQVTAERRNR